MRHTREILRHKWILQLGHRAVRDALGTSHGTITATLQRAQRAGLDWSAVKALSDAELEACPYPPPPSVGIPRPEPDWPRLHLQESAPDLSNRYSALSGDLIDESHVHIAQQRLSVPRTAPLRQRALWGLRHGITAGGDWRGV